ncbi:hypothetical protein BDF19DRAFT_414783 [Syncephalis fuscata]|nr:hypothetical protein BDF19DRAFT_414783 [Syncephalis fuscata]
MAAGILPTLERQNKWCKERCSSGEVETWRHIVKCEGNGLDREKEARDKIKDMTRRKVEWINERRSRKDPPMRLLNVGEVAESIVPDQPISNTGFLLGLVSPQTLYSMKREGVREEERRELIKTATKTALDFVWKKIWKTRCKQVDEAIGRWKTQVNQNHKKVRQQTPKAREA